MPDALIADTSTTPPVIKTYHIWLAVVLINVDVFLALVWLSVNSSGGGESVTWAASSLYREMSKMPVSLFVLAFVALSVVPVLIAESNYQYKNRVGYGIPVVLLLALPYFIWHYYTCTGKFCGFIDAVMFVVLPTTAAIAAIFYTAGLLASRGRYGFVNVVLILEVIVFIGAVVYLGSSYF